MTTIETYRVFGLCAALAGGVVGFGCSDNSPGAQGKGGSAGSSTTGNSTTTNSTTSTTSTTTTGAGGSGGGGAYAVTYCDPAKWTTIEPAVVSMELCSDLDAEGSELGWHCMMPGGVW